jgi:predicted phosphodiesterase
MLRQRIQNAFVAVGKVEGNLKILFVHLSDLHISSTNVAAFNLKAEKIVAAVRSVGTIEDCVLVCSGDLTYSGTKNEYAAARQFLGALLSNLGKQFDLYVKLLIVPGNHDMDLSSNTLSASEFLTKIKSIYSKKDELDRAFADEIEFQAPFYEYANSKGCFLNDKVLDTIIKIHGKHKAQYNLLNTAPFSRPKENDKGIHYLPDRYLYSLVKKDGVNLSITLMHHGTEWFCLESKNALEDKLKTFSDIVFQGHEHTLDSYQIDGLVISKGGEFSGKMTDKSTFSILVCDMELRICTETEFLWNSTDVMFCKVGEPRPYPLKSKKSDLVPKEDFVSQFFIDTHKISTSALDYFVFPKLRQGREDSSRTERKIIVEDELWKELKTCKIINLSGKSRSGKTSLLKYLYNNCLSMDFVPLYLRRDSGSIAPDRIIKKLLNKQYGTQPIIHDKYAQTPLEKKILFIDDLDSIANSEKLLNAVHNEVGYIIYTSKKKLQSDLKSATKEELAKNKDTRYIELEEFYKEKRTELLSRVCEIKEQDSASVDFIANTLDYLVDRKSDMFELSPEYIIHYVMYFINNKSAKDHRGEESFNIVFQTNLINLILACPGGKGHIDYCVLMLEEIAFYMHQRKSESICHTDISTIVDELNENRALGIDIEKCLRILLESSIIENTHDINMYTFSSKNYLAYFIAKKLNGIIGRKGFDIPELKHIFTNICFGINDNILMFLSFIRSDTNFALSICNLLQELISEFPELNFDSENIKFIKRQPLLSDSMASERDKDKASRISDETERNKAEEQQKDEIRYKNIYDYDEASAHTYPYRLARAYKYLGIISKSLISHFVNLNKDEKLKIIDLMYSAPNRILYAWLKPYDDNYDAVIDELHSFAQAVELNTTEKAVEAVFNYFAMALCLSLYDNVAFLGANSSTIPLLNGQSLVTSNHKIANLLMTENGSSTDDFMEKAIRLKEDENNAFITNLIQRIANKHLLTRKVHFRQKDRIADKIFSSSSKQQLIVSSQSRKNKKR